MHRIISRNKSTYLKYNSFRKQIFNELAPKDSEAILYLLPWLLSINHPDCPGYLPKLKKSFWVYYVDNQKEIRQRETVFKRMFGVKEKGSLLKYAHDLIQIQGLYTIGSVGTVSQTSLSDCDIWVCYDKSEYDETAWVYLNQKLNLIKGWMDSNIKMPVYFFISDITDIKNSVFGSVDSESCGSAQRNILKEEFYRTCILICGKIPLWWVCFDHQKGLDPDAVMNESRTGFAEYDLVDLGNLESIEKDEYFGAVLWQFHKSLSSPLKTIIKMVLLKTLLDAPSDSLICHRFRQLVMTSDLEGLPPDPSIFTIESIFAYFEEHSPETLEFMKECFYLRCDLKPFDRSQTLKKAIAADLYKRYPMDIKKRTHLSKFTTWDFEEQIDLGARLFKLLVQFYREIFAAHKGVRSGLDQTDLTILGRKITVAFQPKPNKVLVLQKPVDNLNLGNLTVVYNNGDNTWSVFSGSDRTKPVIEKMDIIHAIAFLVWNNLFFPGKLYMEPNPTNVTLQEIINVGNRIRNFMGNNDISHVEYSDYLKPEVVIKVLVIVSFEKSPWEKDINDFGVLYQNSWGELFVARFNSPRKLQNFIKKSFQGQRPAETQCYVQRNSTYYEKIIERTKKFLMPET